MGDVGLSSATVLSGSSFPKVKMLCRCLNLGTCSEEFHEYVQRECTFPTIASSWEKVQRSLLDERRDKKITIAGEQKPLVQRSKSFFLSFHFSSGWNLSKGEASAELEATDYDNILCESVR